MNYKIRYSSSSLSHYGIKGQQWGERRYQNEDGTLTPEGYERYYQLSERNRKNFDNYREMAKGIESTNNQFKSQYAKNPSNRLKSSIEKNDRDIANFRNEAAKILNENEHKQYSKAGTVFAGLGALLLGSGAIRNAVSGGALKAFGAEASARHMNTAFMLAKASGAALLGKRFLAGLKGDEKEKDH